MRHRAGIAVVVVEIVACVVGCHAYTSLGQREFNQHDDWWSIEVSYPIIEGTIHLTPRFANKYSLLPPVSGKSCPEPHRKTTLITAHI